MLKNRETRILLNYVNRNVYIYVIIRQGFTVRYSRLYIVSIFDPLLLNAIHFDKLWQREMSDNRGNKKIMIYALGRRQHVCVQINQISNPLNSFPARGGLFRNYQTFYCRKIRFYEINYIPLWNIVNLIFLCRNKFSVGCRSPPITNFE